MDSMLDLYGPVTLSSMLRDAAKKARVEGRIDDADLINLALLHAGILRHTLRLVESRVETDIDLYFIIDQLKGLL